MVNKESKDINPEISNFELDPNVVIEQILPRGHVIHGYSSASSERVIKILGSTDYSDNAPLLGFGVDGDAEMALARAMASYLQRETDGHEAMTANQYPHITEGDGGTGGHASKFDNIVWGGDFTLFQLGEEVIAKSSYGGGYGLEPLEVRADSAHDAITLLAARYRFISSFKSIRDNLNALPNLTWNLEQLNLTD